MLNMFVFLLTVVDVLVALLLIGIILIQQSKSGGGLTAMGGGMTESVFGASAGNILTKGTVTLAAVFLGITLLLAVITGHRAPRRSVADGLSAKPAAVEESATAGPAASAREESGQAGSAAPAAEGGAAEE